MIDDDKWSKIFNIKNVDILKDYLSTNTISWSNISKLKNRYSNSPLIKLLNSTIGDTIGEKAYRLLNPSIKCKTCKINNTLFYNWQRGYSTYCSKKCALADKELQKNTANKRTKTMMKKYGVAYTLQNEFLYKKQKETMMKKYGEFHPILVKEINEKIQNTNIVRYGHKTAGNNVDIRNKISDTRKLNTFKKYILSANNIEYIDDNPFIYNEDRLWKCKMCGNKFTHNYSSTQRMPICRICNPMVRGTSKFEEELIDFLKNELNIINIERHKRLYYKNDRQYVEIDIFLPEYSIGIEFNGLYWHSELAGKDELYHSKKYNICNLHNIKLITIFEHELTNKKEICESILRAKLNKINKKIYARTLNVIQLDNKTGQKWFNKTHISGNARFSKCLALVDDTGDIKCAASFIKNRFGANKNAYELVRFSNKLNSIVVGGLSKLIKNSNLQHIISYCDKRWGTGQSYLKSGWSYVKTTKPGYWYFDKNGVVYHRSVFQKHKLKKMLNFTETDKTEWQLAQSLNLNRFWDCGNFLYEYKGVEK